MRAFADALEQVISYITSIYMYARTHTRAHTLRSYMFVCVCVYIYFFFFFYIYIYMYMYIYIYIYVCM